MQSNQKNAEKFLIEKLEYTKEDIIRFNKYDDGQILRLYNTIQGIAKNVRDNSNAYNYEAMNP